MSDDRIATREGGERRGRVSLSTFGARLQREARKGWREIRGEERGAGRDVYFTPTTTPNLWNREVGLEGVF